MLGKRVEERVDKDVEFCSSSGCGRKDDIEISFRETRGSRDSVSVVKLVGGEFDICSSAPERVVRGIRSSSSTVAKVRGRLVPFLNTFLVMLLALCVIVWGDCKEYALLGSPFIFCPRS